MEVGGGDVTVVAVNANRVDPHLFDVKQPYCCDSQACELMRCCYVMSSVISSVGSSGSPLSAGTVSAC